MLTQRRWTMVVCIVKRCHSRAVALLSVHKTASSTCVGCTLNTQYSVVLYTQYNRCSLANHSHSNALPWNRINVASAAAAAQRRRRKHVFTRTVQSSAADCYRERGLFVSLKARLCRFDCRLATPSDAVSGTIFSRWRGWSIRVAEHRATIDTLPTVRLIVPQFNFADYTSLGLRAITATW